MPRIPVDAVSGSSRRIKNLHYADLDWAKQAVLNIGNIIENINTIDKTSTLTLVVVSKPEDEIALYWYWR